MNILTRLVAGGILFVVVSAIGSQMDKKTAEKFNLSEAETSTWNKCKRSMSRHEVEFNKGSSENNGCACIAKNAHTKYGPTEIPIAETYLDQFMAAGDDKNTTSVLVSSIESMSKSHKISMDKSAEYFLDISGYISQCGDKKILTSEKIVELASMTPKNIPMATPVQKPVKVAHKAPQSAPAPKPAPKAAPVKKAPPPPKLRGRSKG